MKILRKADMLEKEQVRNKYPLASYGRGGMCGNSDVV
jgi:hypothetical protein